MSAATAAMAALSIATAAISFGVGYVAQLFVKATPFDGDPRSVSGTHVLYTVDELRKMNDKERVDAYYNKRADLHDVLEAVVETRDPAQAYVKLKEKKDMELLTKAIKEFYPKAAVPDTPPPPTAPLVIAKPVVPPPTALPDDAESTPLAEPPKAPTLVGGARPTDAGHLQFGGGSLPLVLPAVPAAVAVGL